MLILYGNVILIILAHCVVGLRERDRGFSLRISVLFRMTRIIDPLALSCHFVPRGFNRVAEHYSKLYIAALIYLDCTWEKRYCSRYSKTLFIFIVLLIDIKIIYFITMILFINIFFFIFNFTIL